MTLFKQLLPIFILVAFWDAFTTVFGTISILGEANIGTIITGVVVSIIMLVVFFLTFAIWGDAIENEFMMYFLRALWIVAFVYDIYTSFYGNSAFIAGGTLDGSEIAVVTMATFIVSGSTIVASWLLSE